MFECDDESSVADIGERISYYADSSVDTCYFKLRYTFLDGGKTSHGEVFSAIAEIVKSYKPTCCSAGIHYAHDPDDGYKEQRPHFHIHFGFTAGLVKRTSIRDRIKKYLKSIGDERTGNTQMALTQVSDESLRDFEKFFNYPLHEYTSVNDFRNRHQYVLDYCNSINPLEDEEWDTRCKISHGIQQVVVADVEKRREALQKKLNDKEAIYVRLAELHCKKPFTTFEQVLDAVIDDYDEHAKDYVPKTMKNQALTFAARAKVFNREEVRNMISKF